MQLLTVLFVGKTKIQNTYSLYKITTKWSKITFKLLILKHMLPFCIEK